MGVKLIFVSAHPLKHLVKEIIKANGIYTKTANIHERISETFNEKYRLKKTEITKRIINKKPYIC
jgi:hypothetical protein